MDKFFFLLQETNLLQEICASSERDLTIAKWPAFKKKNPLERVALMEQRALKQRALKKFSWGDQLLWTPMGLEQTTRQSVGQFKIKKLSNILSNLSSFPKMIDLCCGMGGDSFFVPETVIGVDRDLETLRMYQHNVESTRSFLQNNHKGKVCGILGDVCSTPILSHVAKNAVACIDPARRSNKEGSSWGKEGLSPSLEELLDIQKYFPNMVVKLGPGMELPEALCQIAEVEFLGDGDECVEVALWMGELGVPGTVRVSEVHTGETLFAPREALKGYFTSSSRVKEPGGYLHEPIKSVVRSHLFGILAEKLGLWQIDEKTAYLSGNQALYHPFLKSYQILGSCSLHIKHIQKLVDQHHIGRLEVKKRGVALLPEEIKKKLKLKGDKSGVLVLGRVANKKVAFLTKTLK